MVIKNFRHGLGELYRGLNISATVKELQKFVPSLRVSDVARGPSGVRAQAMDADGNLVDDFVFDSGIRLNSPLKRLNKSVQKISFFFFYSRNWAVE